MIGGLLRLGVLGTIAAVVADRWLARSVDDAPPPPIRSEVVIDAPIEQVWSVVADVENQPRWMHELKAVRLDGDGPVGVGTTGTGSVRILGISVEDPITITEFEPPRRFAIRHDGLYKGGGVITLEPGADGTTTIVRWDETLIPPVLPHVGSAVQRPILREIFQEDLHRLRRLVEQG